MAQVLKAALEKKFPEALEKDTLKVDQHFHWFEGTSVNYQ